MSTLDQTSAKIYQFPIGGRSGPARRDQTINEPAGHNVLTSSSWYHEAAMLDEQQPKPQ